jgi:hypothetical protein
MKPILKHSLLALAGITLSPTAVMASDDFVSDDLCIAFYAYTGNVVEPITYVVNLGQASLFRENTLTDVAVSSINTALVSSNIGADLTATFGPNWAETDTVRWCVVGGISQGSPNVSGDPERTTYLSRSRASLATGATGAGSTIPIIIGANRSTLSTALVGVFRGANDGINFVDTNTSVSGINIAGAVLPISNNRSFDEYVPPVVTGLYFGQAVDPTQTFGAGSIAGGAGVEGALDLYRVLHTLTGADLTAGASTASAATGVGQFIGTLTIDSSGNLKIRAVGSATGSYTTWASTNNVTGGTNGDSDNDGISNLVEYALALNPAASDGAPGSFTGGTLSFAKRAVAVANGDVTYAIQESDDLGVSDPWQTVTPTTNTTSAITYLLPTGSPKKFARLVVNSIP